MLSEFRPYYAMVNRTLNPLFRGGATSTIPGTAITSDLSKQGHQVTTSSAQGHGPKVESCNSVRNAQKARLSFSHVT